MTSETASKATRLTYLQVQKYLEQLKLTQALSSLDRVAEEAAQGEWHHRQSAL